MQPAAQSMKGKVCLVTGATSGIGAVAARELARRGAQVVIVGRDPATLCRHRRGDQKPHRSRGRVAARRPVGATAGCRPGPPVPRTAHTAGRARQQRRSHLPEASGNGGWPRAHLRAEPPGLFPAHAFAARPGSSQCPGAHCQRARHVPTRERLSTLTICKCAKLQWLASLLSLQAGQPALQPGVVAPARRHGGDQQRLCTPAGSRPDLAATMAGSADCGNSPCAGWPSGRKREHRPFSIWHVAGSHRRQRSLFRPPAAPNHRRRPRTGRPHDVCGRSARN